MTRRLFVAVGLIACLSPLGTDRLHAEPGFFLKEMPDLEVTIEEKPATADEAKRIKQLIQELAATNAPDIGYSASLTGDAFGPLPDLDWRGTENITHHGLKHSDTLERLVAFGPKALPFLLDALDDKTPTKLIVHSVCDFPKASVNPSPSGTYTLLASIAFQTRDCPVVPAREILFNPLNRTEARALKTADVDRMTTVRGFFGDRKEKLPAGHIKDQIEYNVAVGDLCLVAVGQITNRPYPAARYQPTGHTFINSSAHDPEIAKAVRSVWTKKAYRRQLFDSLLIDFHTRGADDRGTSERLQLGAATRLLYYFPDEAGLVVAGRLHDLNVGSDIDLHAIEGHDANGIWADELLQAVAFTENKAVRRELLDIFRRTADQKIALTALPGIDEDRRPEVLAKLELFLKLLPKKEERLYGDGYQLMKAVAKNLGHDRYELFRKYLTKAGARAADECRVLRTQWVQNLPKEFLVPWLEDKTVAFTAKDDWDGVGLRLPGKRRICDEVAYTLARHLEGVSFDPEAKEVERDKQIDAIRKKLY